MNTVYRIQDNDCRGPFAWHDDDYYERIGIDLWHAWTIKAPIEENYDISLNEHCGFETLNEIFEWFTDEQLDILKDNGFFIVKIENVKVNFIGEQQVIFEFTDNSLIEKIETILC